MESIEQVFNGTADFGKKITCTISRNGDLIYRTYLRVQLPAVTVPAAGSGTAYTGFRWLNNVGHILIKTVELEIGGQRIDRHYGDWLNIWNELTQSAGHMLGYANMVGNVPQLVTPLFNTNTSATATVNGQILYVPLEFWFARNPGLALPLIALIKVGRKSIQPKVFEHCYGKKMLGSQDLFLGQPKMLVACC